MVINKIDIPKHAINTSEFDRLGFENTVAVSAEHDRGIGDLVASIEQVLDPRDPDIYRALAGGVTTANVLHGSANPIGGTNAVIKLRWGADARGLLFAGAPPGIKFAMGENPKRSNFTPAAGQERRYPATRMGVLDVIREAFTEARAYQEEWRRYEVERKAAEKNKGSPTPLPPRRDLRLEPLVEVVTPAGRLAYGPVKAADVAGLFESGFLQGREHPFALGPTDDIPYFKVQQRLTFAP